MMMVGLLFVTIEVEELSMDKVHFSDGLINLLDGMISGMA